MFQTSCRRTLYGPCLDIDDLCCGSGQGALSRAELEPDHPWMTGEVRDDFRRSSLAKFTGGPGQAKILQDEIIVIMLCDWGRQKRATVHPYHARRVVRGG